MEKFKDHPAVVKDFYVEDPEIAAMTVDEVKEYRKENFNIHVELFKKTNLSYTCKKNDEEKRTPEEIEKYLLKRIDNPSKSQNSSFICFTSHSIFPRIIDCSKRLDILMHSLA